MGKYLVYFTTVIMLQCVMARIDPPAWSMSTTNRVSVVPLKVCQAGLYVGAALPLRFLIEHRYQLIAALPPLENSQICMQCFMHMHEHHVLFCFVHCSDEALVFKVAHFSF